MTKKLTVYDGNNWFRRRIEADLTGKPVSTCFQEIQINPSFPIIIWDGKYALQTRRKMYPEYKSRRKPAGESIYESQNLLKKVLKLGKGITIEVEGFEGDDVIAHVVRKYEAKGYNIFIESNDADLAQLGKPMARKTFKIEPKWVVLYKVLVGDSSDSIPGAKGFGNGTWEKLDDNHKVILMALVNSYYDETPERVAELLKHVPLPKGVFNWLLIKENRHQLLTYNKIVNFLPISDELINKNTIMGLNKPELAQPIFEEFML